MKAEKTREVIATSFYQLIEKYNFSDITVKMICDKAGVSRSTFYRFFNDKHDVLISYFSMTYDKIGNKYPDAKDYKLLIYEYSQLIYDDSKFFDSVLKISGQNSLRDHIYQTGFDYYVQHIENKTGKKITEELLFKIILFTAGMSSLYIEWIERGFSVAPEQLTEIIIDSMPIEMLQYFQ